MPMSTSSQIIMETLTRGTGAVVVGARAQIIDSASMETMVDLCGRVRTEEKEGLKMLGEDGIEKGRDFS